MHISTLVQVLKSLGVALLVAGVLYGAALGWSSELGIPALWMATAVAFVGTAAGLLAAAALKDTGHRPAGAPTAWRVGLGVGWLLMALSSALVLLQHRTAAAPYLTFLVVHAGAQLLLHFVTFRKQDTDEIGGGTHLDAGTTS